MWAIINKVNIIKHKLKKLSKRLRQKIFGRFSFKSKIHHLVINAANGFLFGLAINILFRPNLAQQIIAPIIIAVITASVGSISWLLINYFIGISFLAIIYAFFSNFASSIIFPSVVFQIISIIIAVFLTLLRKTDELDLSLRRNKYFELFAVAFSLLLSIIYSANLHAVGKLSAARFLLGAEDNDAWLFNIAHLQKNGLISLNHIVASSMGSEIPGFFLGSSLFGDAFKISDLNLLLSANVMLTSVGLLLISIPIVSTVQLGDTKIFWKKLLVWLLSFVLIFEFGAALSAWGSIDSFLGLFLMFLVISIYRCTNSQFQSHRAIYFLSIIILSCGASLSWPPLFPITLCLSAFILFKIFQLRSFELLFIGFLSLSETAWSWHGFIRAGISNLLRITGGTNQITFQMLVLLAVFSFVYLVFVIYSNKFKLRNYAFPMNIVVYVVGYIASIYLFTRFVLHSTSTYGLPKLEFVLAPILLIVVVSYFVQGLQSWFFASFVVVFSLALSPFTLVNSYFMHYPPAFSSVPNWYSAVQENVGIYGNTRSIICLSTSPLQDWNADMDSYLCNRFAASEQGLDSADHASWRFIAIGRVAVSMAPTVLDGLGEKKPIVVVLGDKRALIQPDAWFHPSYIKLKSLDSDFIFINKS